MPSLTEVRDAAVALLRTVHPDISRVEAFSGEITLGAVAGKGLPPGVSVLVAAVAADNDALGNSLDFDVVATFGALIVSNNVAGAEYRGKGRAGRCRKDCPCRPRGHVRLAGSEPRRGEEP